MLWVNDIYSNRLLHSVGYHYFIRCIYYIAGIVEMLAPRGDHHTTILCTLFNYIVYATPNVHSDRRMKITNWIVENGSMCVFEYSAWHHLLWHNFRIAFECGTRFNSKVMRSIWPSRRTQMHPVLQKSRAFIIIAENARHTRNHQLAIIIYLTISSKHRIVPEFEWIGIIEVQRK